MTLCCPGSEFVNRLMSPGVFLVWAALSAQNEQVFCEDADTAESTAVTFRLQQAHPNFGRFQSIEADGNAFIERQNRRPSDAPAVSEGFFLGFARDSTLQSPTRGFNTLMLIQVTEVMKDGWNVRISPRAAKVLRSGAPVSIIRPVAATTAQMKQMPEIAPIEEVKVAPDPSIQSRNNLKHIALAFHNFHDVYGQFPPAVINGPDGTPWHSWRVLLLPYLDQGKLYNEYNFNEPWNGPGNKQLMDRMPAVFRDPLNGNAEDHFTQYAVAVGSSTVFQPEGGTLETAGRRIQVNGGRRIRDITDGTSNTILVGSVSPDRKIPWMKPEDIAFDDNFAGIGNEGGFSAPLKVGEETAGVFALCDGSVLALRSSIDKTLLHKLITSNQGEVTGTIPKAGFGSQGRRGGPQISLQIVDTEQGVVARLIRETQSGR